MTDVGGVMDACKRQKKLHECGWRGRSPTSGLLEAVGTGALLGFACLISYFLSCLIAEPKPACKCRHGNQYTTRRSLPFSGRRMGNSELVSLAHMRSMQTPPRRSGRRVKRWLERSFSDRQPELGNTKTTAGVGRRRAHNGGTSTTHLISGLHGHSPR